MAHPADKSDKEIQEGTQTLQEVADEIDQEGGVKRTISAQDKAEEQQTDDADPTEREDEDDEENPVEDKFEESPMGGYGRLGKGQQS